MKKISMMQSIADNKGNLTMNKKKIKATVFRFDPTKDSEPCYKIYMVPIEKGTSAMNILDYIYQNLDDSLAYYDHAGCDLGICARCLGRVNGKPGLLCQTLIYGDVKLEPVSKKSVLKDMISKKKEKKNQRRQEIE